MNLIPAIGAALAVLSLPVFADTALLSLTPSDVKIIGGIHVDRTRNSPFGQFVLSQMNQSDKHFSDFIAATGFDPRRDLTDIVFASTGPGKNGPGLVLASGVFNGPQILAGIKAKAKTGATMTRYAGVDVLDLNGGKTSLAIVDGRLAVAGDSAMVRSALDRRASGSPDTPLALKAATASGKFDAWMVTSGVFAPPVPGPSAGTNGNAGPNLQGILETGGGLTFGSLIEFSGEAVTRSDKDAQALADVVRFLGSMMQLQGGENGPARPETQAMQQIFNSLQIQTQANLVKLSFSLPQADLEKLIQAAPARRAAANRR